MSKFLTSNNLNFKIEEIFKDAQEEIRIISPFIKLHDNYAAVLKRKIEDDRIKLIIVFGKNEDDLSKSIKQDDLQFFKDFPNVEIRYERRLHAKYYANESFAVLTSMNLYSFSQNNNIEAGILMNTNVAASIVSSLTREDNLDLEAWKYFEDVVIKQSVLLFKKTPKYESAIFGLTKNYSGSITEVDKLADFFSQKVKVETFKQDKGNELQKPVQSISQLNDNFGFCIRTGKQITFNRNMPFCNEAYLNWVKYNNENYPENYCHFSGEISKGETTKAKPILRKNWNEAKRKFNL